MKVKFEPNPEKNSEPYIIFFVVIVSNLIAIALYEFWGFSLFDFLKGLLNFE